MSLNIPVRFSDNVGELKTHLSEGLNQIEALTSASEKMAQSLGGDRLKQSAANLVGALEKLGGAQGVLAGVEKLSSAERERANALIDKAIAKYKLLGETAPTALQDVSKAMHAASTETSHWGDVVSSTFGQMTAALSAASLIGKATGTITDLGREALATAGHLVDLSNKTGLGTETLQRMDFVAKQSGSDMAQFADATFKMGVNIAEGTGKARAGAEALGLDWQALRAASPDAQFNLVVAALEKMEDPQQRNAAAVALFGKTAKEILPAIVDGYTKVASQATIAGDAQIKALDAAGDAWDRFKIRTTSAFVNAVGSMLLLHQAVAQLSDGERDFILKTESATATIEDYDKALIQAAADKAKFGNIGGFGGGGADVSLPTEVRPKPTPSFGTDLKEAEAGFLALTAATKADIEAALQLGKSSDDIINKLNITEGVLALAKKAFEEHKGAVSKAAEEQKKFAEALSEMQSVGEGWAGTLDTIDGTVVEAIKFYLEAGVSQEKLATAYALTGTQVKAVASSLKDHVDALKIADEIQTKFTAEGDKHWKEWFASVDKNLKAANALVVSTFEGFLKAQKDYHTAVVEDTLSADDIARNKLQEQLNDAKVKLAQLGESYRSTYDLIAKTVEIKLSEIGTLWKEHPMIDPNAPKQITEVISAVDALSQTFAKLGQFAGGTFGSILSGTAAILQALDKYQVAVTKFGQGSLQANQAQRNVGFAAVAAGSNLVAQTINTGPTARPVGIVAAGTAQGTAVGAGIAPFAGPYAGAAIGIGAGVGTIVGLIESGKEWRKVFNDIARDFSGIHVSEDFAKMIDDLESATGLQRVQALTTQLDKLIEQAGGLNSTNLDLFISKLHDAFSYLETGTMTIQQVAQVVDKNFANMAAASTDSLGRISDSMKEIILLDERMGTASKAIDDFLSGQAAAVGAGLTDLLDQPMIHAANDIGQAVKDAQDAVDKDKAALADATAGTNAFKDATDTLQAAQDTLTEALTNQHREADRNKQALQDLGTAAVFAFDAAIASGMTFVDALKSVGPQLSTIKTALEDLGIPIDDMDAGLKGLLTENEILNGKDGKGGVGKTISGLQTIVTAGTNMPGLMTPDMFAAQERILGSAYTQTQAAAANAGVTGTEGTIASLVPFQAVLHEMEEWAKKNGVELDAETQDKIKQSKELGLWTDAYKTDAQQTRDSMADLVKSNTTLADAIGGLPSALAALVNAGHVTIPGGPGPGHDPTNPQPQAEGGSGYAAGPMTFSTQGNEFWAFSGEGKSWGNGGGGWPSRAPDSWPLPAYLPDGDAGKGGATTIVLQERFDITVSISTVDATGLDEFTEKSLLPRIVDQIEDRRRGYAGRLQRVLMPTA